MTQMYFNNVAFDFNTLQITDNFASTKLYFSSYNYSGKTIEIYLNEFKRDLKFDIFEESSMPKIKVIAGKTLGENSYIELGFNSGIAPDDWYDSFELEGDLIWDSKQNKIVVMVKEDDNDKGLEAWAIALIVIACVIVIGAFVGVTIWFVIKKKKSDEADIRQVA